MLRTELRNPPMPESHASLVRVIQNPDGTVDHIIRLEDGTLRKYVDVRLETFEMSQESKGGLMMLNLKLDPEPKEPTNG